MKSELDLINYLQTMKTSNKNIINGIGDDCAVVKFHNKKKYVLTTDTSLLGPHFSKDYTPEEIGHKSLASNLSDIASMGCKPLYALYALTVPDISESWIKRFFRGTRKLLNKYNVSIIGGDTTRGPMSISITLIGEQKNSILTRKGAKSGDGIYVTGIVGSARAALLLDKRNSGYNYFRKSLVKPEPRVMEGIELSKFASSCIDISDGLAKDLKSIAISSNKGFDVEVDSIPTSRQLARYIKPHLRDQCVLGGGEDYELCFTANDKYISKINALRKKLKLKITRIGVITDSGFVYKFKQKVYKPKVLGYDHFKA